MEEREGGIHSSLARRQERVQERSRARRRRGLVWVVGALALIVVFFVGLVLGCALDSDPRPGGSQTCIRNLNPSTLPPLTRTVTVTSSSP
jgi:ABC-type Fe3+ transport system permease subunit